MKLFGRSSGYYLFWVSVVYLTIGMYNIFVHTFIRTEALQVAWISALAFPFICPPYGRWINLDVTWDKDMLNWFKSKKDNETNVVKFPEQVKVPAVPEVTPPKEEPAKIFYRLGLTDNNRVAFSMGYSEVTMNYEGCQQMIDQIKFFQSQLREETDD